jgi:hypothetical protein
LYFIARCEFFHEYLTKEDQDLLGWDENVPCSDTDCVIQMFFWKGEYDVVPVDV